MKPRAVHAAPAPNYLDPQLPRGLSTTRIPVLKATASNLQGYGRLVAEGLALAGKLGHEATAFTRQYLIPQGQFLGLGTDPSSLDGRYYGPLPQSRIRGHAVVLF